MLTGLLMTMPFAGLLGVAAEGKLDWVADAGSFFIKVVAVILILCFVAAFTDTIGLTKVEKALDGQLGED